MDGIQISLVEAIIVSSVTAGLGTAATIAALKVHIMYLRESITRIDKSVNRAHERIDEIEKG